MSEPAGNLVDVEFWDKEYELVHCRTKLPIGLIPAAGDEADVPNDATFSEEHGSPTEVRYLEVLSRKFFFHLNGTISVVRVVCKDHTRS